MKHSNKHLIIILGPTAVGKTSLAIRLAKHFYTEIISSDSRQFYKELNIGTAKPTDEEMKEVKHHFISHVSIDQLYSAGDFEREAIAKLDELFVTKDVVVMVGGSGLYIKAICEGLAETPKANEELRNRLQAIFEREGIESLQQMLKNLDADKYQKVDLQNPQRIMRAIEIAEETNIPVEKINKQIATRNFNTIKIGLTISRELLYERINNRVDEMIKNGLLKEAHDMHLHKDLNALQTVGYTELFDYIDGKNSLEFAIDKIKQHTRNFAKRQLTWFRKEEDVKWFETNDFERIVTYIESK
ncbi:MAG: tRNA (adenosine(37)-N6)-dimethylallyltransferase MiaA [Bacteroidota bacterium]